MALFTLKPHHATAEPKDETKKSKNQLKREARSALRQSMCGSYRELKREKQRQKRSKSSSISDVSRVISISELKYGSALDVEPSLTSEKRPEIQFIPTRDQEQHPIIQQQPDELNDLKDQSLRHSRGLVLFDTAFDTLMLPKERSSLVAQLARCHGTNKRFLDSFYKLLIGPLSPQLSLLLDKYCAVHWENVSFFPKLQGTAIPDVSKAEEASIDSRNDETIGLPSLNEGGIMPPLRIFYLSADAEHILTESEMAGPLVCIVIGALVDRNRHKGAGLKRAKELGIPAVRLPIQESGILLNTSTVLTVNQGL